MDVILSTSSKTILLSRAGRAGVLAHLLTTDQLFAGKLVEWVDRLVAHAAMLDLGLNALDVRALLPEPIELLEDVLAKSHPSQLRGYGELDSTTSQILEGWCARGRVVAAPLVSVWRHIPTPQPNRTGCEPAFLEILALSRYQRNALSAYLQVADDAVRSFGSVLRLARAPYAPLFTSSLTNDDIACCDAACAELAALLTYGHAWVAQPPLDRRRSMILEHLRDAETALVVLFEGSRDRQRTILAELLIDLSHLKRRV